jgi:ADP-ribosylglycohydrolase
VLLGTAVGDALGLAREGLSRRRADRLFGAAGQEEPPVWAGLLLRNLLTLAAVIAHVVRRLLPPY